MTQLATETPFVRIALVQFDYPPSAVLPYSFMEEPAQLGDNERGIAAPFPFTVSKIEQQITTLRHKVAEKYEGFIRKRVGHILKRLNDMSVDVVVFPEYSIPASCLSTIDEFAGDCTVVAASHAVTSETVDICQKLNISVNSDAIGKSICPIRMKDGNWLRVDKLTKSRFERDLTMGKDWQLIPIPDRKGREWCFAVLLCFDFINDHDRNYVLRVQSDLWDRVDFCVVPSYSPPAEDFDQHAIPLAKRAGVPIVYANTARYGGSKVYCHFGDHNIFTDKHGTKVLEPDDEAIVIVDLPTKHYQFDPKPTPFFVPSTSKLVSLLPILSRKWFPQYCELYERVHKTQDVNQKRAILREALPELKSLISQRGVTNVLKTKIFALHDAIDKRDVQWLENCLNHIAFSGDEGSLYELRYPLIRQTKKLLHDIMDNSRVRGDERDNFNIMLETYIHYQDYIKDHIPEPRSQKFNATDPAIHTLDDPTSPTFTTVFLMRLRSARVHREALEKQIRLISTLAYEGNDHLTLNLRYRSLPNPSGNLKDLEIQIFGAAIAEDRSDSRRMADSFRRDLVNLMRVTLHDAYLFQLEEMEEEKLMQVTEPFGLNHIVELRRKIEFEKYGDQSSAPKIYHLEGNSSIARILDTLQSSPFACMISIHLHPVALTEAEKAFFQRYSSASSYRSEGSEGTMFYLGVDKQPALRMSESVIMRRMMGDVKRIHPSLMLRLFVASDEPISKLLLNTIGNELWGNESYDIYDFASNKEGHDVVADALRRVWASSIPAYVVAPEGQDKVPFLFDPYEASRMFRLPLDGHSAAVGKLFSVIPAPAAALPEEGIEIGLGFHSGAQKPIVVRLSDGERTKHTHIMGKTGTGKSTFDPTHTDCPFGLNLLEFDPEDLQHKDFVVQETIAIMRKMFFFEHIGPVFEHCLRHLVLTILDDSMNREGTLIEVPRLIYDEEFRKAVVSPLKDDLASDYWNQYSKLDENTKSELLMYVVSKFDTFTVDRLMRNIIGQAKSTINIADIMDKKKILLVKLPSAVIGELNAALLGMIIISKLRWVGMRRADRPPGERKDYFLYVDEFQNFAASGFDTLLAEARKYGLSLILSHQHVGQLSAFNIATGQIEGRVAQAVFGNVGTIIAFRLGVSDAKFMAEEMGEPVDPEDFVNLKNYHAIVKTLIDGEVYPPFTVKTVLSTTPVRKEIAEKIRKESLDRYGTNKEDVEHEIRERARRIIKRDDSS
jgi:predicted amidohydrolase